MSPTYGTLDQGYDYYLSDKWSKDYHFKILSFTVSNGLVSEATNFSQTLDIDRQRKTVENLVKMIQPNCSSNYDFEIQDPSD